MTLLAPMWLSGLLLVPVIRWLHRGGRHRRSVGVSRLALWRGSAAGRPAAGERRPPDPAWRRRALFTALLVVVLSEPRWPEQPTQVTLWVDDSLSMLTREPRETRLALGLAQARALLAELPQAQAEVRALGDPWRSLGALDDQSVAAVLAGAGRKEPGAPPAALLRRDHQHWLLTDGADAALFDWPGDRQPDRIVQVAGVTRNVGLERLSARRSPVDPGQLDLLFKLANGGTANEVRELVVLTDAGEVARSTVHVDAGRSVDVMAAIPASAGVRARLEPADALPEDDTIALDLAVFRRHRVATDSKCPAALAAAVDTHPALVRAPGNGSDVDAALDCGTGGAAEGVATIRVLADRTPARPGGPVQWSPDLPRSVHIALDAERLQVSARLAPRPGDAVLLTLGDEPVIVRRARAGMFLETSLDFGAVELARGPELPLLVNLMFERLFDGRLLDPVASTDRGPASTRVAPSARARGTPVAQAPGPARRLADLTPPLLLAATLALLWEIVVLIGQWRRFVVENDAGIG